MKVTTSYTDLSDAEVIPTSATMLEALVKDPTLFDALLKALPTREQLVEAHERFEQSLKEKSPTRQADRKELNRKLARFATLVKLAAEEDPTLPLKAGVPLQREKSNSSPPPLTAPLTFRVKHGDQHGVMLGKATPVKRARSYEVERCEGDPTVEANWTHCCNSVSSSKIEITGLTPGTVYSFRVRGLAPGGPGPWSSYVTLMAI